MTWHTFIAEVVLLSLSGVMSPGPLTAVTMTEGTRNPHAGALLSLGHGAVEIPLMILLFLGFGALLEGDGVQQLLLASGGIVLLVMGTQILLQARKGAGVPTSGTRRSPIIAGVILSAGNPYFIVWWATVGLTLISKSAAVGSLGFPILVVVHWLCDFCWLYLLSALSWKAGKALGWRFQKVAALIAGVVVLVFAVRFLTQSSAAILYGA